MIDITENESKLMNFSACRERERERTEMEYVNQTGNGKSSPCGRFYFQLQRLDADFEENSILNNDNDRRI